jgi:hypothetical protein
MKKIFFLFAVLTFFYTNSYSQFGDILKKVTNKVAKTDLLEEKNVTTSIDDALAIAFWLKDLPDYQQPIEPETYNFELKPGYYRFTVQSYCLKAGTHGPTKGSGYLLAPLKGKRSDLVYNIVERSVDHPEIQQHDIQVLLWGIIYNEKFTDYPLDFQNRVRPLLSTAEIADLSLDIKSLPYDAMPDDVKEIAKSYSDLRQRLTDPNITYNELEQSTMLNGYLPDEPFSKIVQNGLWAYVENGFYMRALPISYPTTVLEIYRPTVVTITRDERNRITGLEKDGYKIDITYDDDPEKDVINFGDKGYYPIWRYKSIKLTSPNPDEQGVLENAGWVIKDKGEQIKNYRGTTTNDSYDPIYSQYMDRLKNAKTEANQYNDYLKDKKLHPKAGANLDFNGLFTSGDFNANQHMKDGLKVALDPKNKKGQMDWIEKHLKVVKEWWNNASSALAGEENIDNGPKKIDLSKTPAVPATNGMQRLIPSRRKQSE